MSNLLSVPVSCRLFLHALLSSGCDVGLYLAAFVRNHFRQIVSHAFCPYRETLPDVGDLLLDEGVDVPFPLGFMDLVEIYQDAGLFSLAEFMVYASPEHLHGRGETHV